MKYWICFLVGVLSCGLLHAGEDPHSLSKEALYAYYDRPLESTPIRIKTSHGKINVEICADLCDLFSVPVAEGLSSRFWDAILLFKSYVSTSRLDVKFSEENSELAERLLNRWVNSEKCQAAKSSKQKALCVVGNYGLHAGFEHAEVVYDEGNRCLVYRSFDAQQTLLQSRPNCTRVAPR